MKKRNLLIAGLTATMLLSSAMGLAACNGDTPVEPDPELPAHEHTFSDQWASDETFHWHAATCDDTTDVKDKARHTFETEGRTCTVCNYERSIEATYEMYLVGSILSVPTMNWPKWFNDEGSIAAIRSKCIKMTLSEDQETFTVSDIYLRTRDRFAVYNYTERRTYPAMAGDASIYSCYVEEDNTYNISWKIGENTLTCEVHDHVYDTWDYDGTNHWKKCEKDGQTDQSTLAKHEYQDGVCECGAVGSDACEHTSGFQYAYTDDTVPVPEEAGGTLKKICPDCYEEESVAYNKGHVSTATSIAKAAKIELENAEKCYIQGNLSVVSFKVSAAGTYTVSVESVFEHLGSSGTSIPALYGLAVDSSSYALGNFLLKNKAIVASAAWTTNEDQLAKKEQYHVTVDGFDGTTYQQLKSVSLTFSAEDLEGEELYVYIAIREGATKSSVDSTGSFLAELAYSAPEAEAVAQEYALLPEWKRA